MIDSVARDLAAHAGTDPHYVRELGCLGFLDDGLPEVLPASVRVVRTIRSLHESGPVIEELAAAARFGALSFAFPGRPATAGPTVEPQPHDGA
jgi:hypothetical protein